MQHDVPIGRMRLAAWLTLAVAGIGIGLAGAWMAIDVLLIAFAGVLFAVFLDAVGRLFSRIPKISRKTGVAVAFGLVMLLGLGSLTFLAGAVIQDFSKLVTALGEIGERAQAWLAQYEWSRQLAQQPDSFSQDLMSQLSLVPKAAGGALAVFGGVLLVLFLGIFLALDPGRYARGLAAMVPEPRRAGFLDILDKLAERLRHWMIGMGASMLAVGIATGLGLWAVGAPLAFLLALLSAVFELVPNFGPFTAAMIGIGVASTAGSSTAMGAAAVYTVVQFFESYIVLPVIMKRYADLPPALTLLGVGVLGVLFGFIGVLLATPLLACVHVLFESFAPGCRRQESQSGQETYVPSKASTREGSWQGMAPGVDPQPAR